MVRQRTYQVSQVARITGISVRTLHHYDAIGLLIPRRRTDAGYRVYDQDDLLRLQHILIGREQGFALEEIRRQLDDPRFDRVHALRTQKRQLQERAERTDAMIRAVDAALEILADDEGGTMDMQQLFDGFDPSEHEAEAEERWGDTDAHRESAKRTRRYGNDDWRQVKEEQDAIYADAAQALQDGRAPDSAEAMDVAERHRRSIERWFYPCSTGMHTNLADLWESDARFAASIDAHAAGLTPYLAAAVRANARRHAGSSER